MERWMVQAVDQGAVVGAMDGARDGYRAIEGATDSANG